MKLTVKVIVLGLLIANCGRRVGPVGPSGVPGLPGVPGSKGDTGDSGLPGNPGQDGYNSLVSTLPSVSCLTGGITLLTGLDLDRDNDLSLSEVTASADVCNGATGAQGSQGEVGETGQAGQDGVDGQNGLDAPPTAFTPVGLVDPCGDAPGIYDEVFLKLNNGTLLASFSQNASGLNTRFSVLVPGSYGTTDGDGCSFSVDVNGVIYNENHHY